MIASLARPGGNTTGLSILSTELTAKRLELLKEAMPDLTEAGVLLNPANAMNEPVLPEVKKAARDAYAGGLGSFAKAEHEGSEEEGTTRRFSQARSMTAWTVAKAELTKTKPPVVIDDFHAPSA